MVGSEASSETQRPRASVDGLTIDHVFLTRFNLPSVGPESLIRAQDGWLQDRVELFEQFTVPSLRQQSAPDSFSWLIFFDEQSPGWLIDRLAPLVERGAFSPVYGEQFTNEEVIEQARRVTGAQGDVLLTTTLDNDDAVAADFAERIQRLAVRGRATALYLENGIILSGTSAFLRHDPQNAFVSVAEPWDGAKSVWRDWHNRLHQYMPVRTEGGRPGWLQVVHGRNVSNRVRGKLVDPTKYSRDFPDQLVGAASPSRGSILRDRLIRIPLRESRETVRRVGKNLLLATIGRSGLDRVKEAIQRRRG